MMNNRHLLMILLIIKYDNIIFIKHYLAGTLCIYDNNFLGSAGIPAANTLSSISFNTKEQAPITELLPILTPFKIVTFIPIQTLSPINTDESFSNPGFLIFGRTVG